MKGLTLRNILGLFKNEETKFIENNFSLNLDYEVKIGFWQFVNNIGDTLEFELSEDYNGIKVINSTFQLVEFNEIGYEEEGDE